MEMSESIAARIKSNKRQRISSEKFDGSDEKPHKRSKSNKKSEKNSQTFEQNIGSELTLDELNDDVLEEILKHLPFVHKIQCQIVSKRWQQLLTRLLTKQTSLGMKNIGYDRSDCSLSCRHSVAEEDIIDRAVFQFDGDSYQTDMRRAVQLNPNQCFNNLKIILRKCPKILALDLSSFKLNDNLVKLIDEFCPKLECLHFNSMIIDDNVWESLSKRLGKRLIHLTIRNSIQLYQKPFVEQLIRNCYQMKCLKVTEWDKNLEFQWFDYICQSVTEIHISCTSAKRLFSSEVRVNKNIKRLKLSTFDSLSQSVINSIGNTFTNLTKIVLRNCEGSLKRSYHSFGQLSELRDLTMDLPYANCDEDFALLTKNCTKMKRIELNFGLLTLNSLQIIGKNWNQLESVSIRFVTIERFKESLDVFNGWKHLKRLNLNGTNISDDICQVIETSDSLRHLNLDFCYYLSKSVVNSMISRSKQSPKQLFELSIKETKIQKFYGYKNVNHLSDGVIRIRNLYIYFTTKDLETF